VRRFWDHAAQAPESYASYLVGRNIARRIAGRLRRARDVLDFGCGPGFLIPYLAAYGPHVGGCELSPDTAALANARLAGLANFEGVLDAAEWRKRQRSFDLVTCVEVIEHLKDDALDAALQSIHMLLKPRGILIVTTPNDEDLNQSMVVCPNCSAHFHRWQHVRNWTAASLSALLDAKGFRVLTAQADDFAFPPGFPWTLARFARDRIAGKRKRPQLLVQAMRT
jgi:2-polyprenyl-3-methyl-5-hydroxy-6-metoxy-1,4-benzoquinol methylase